MLELNILPRQRDVDIRSLDQPPASRGLNFSEDRMPSQKNIKIVEETKKMFEESEGFVLTEYRGLTVSEITNLRKKLREDSCEYRVVKNTLLKLALQELGYPDFDNYLAGPTAVAVAREDVIKLAKDLVDFSKEKEKLVVKAGYIDGQVLSSEDIKRIARLPSREELVGKILGSLKSPLYRLANVMVAPARSLVVALSEVAKQKEATS